MEKPPRNCRSKGALQYPLIPTSVYGKKYPKGYEKAIETISVEMILEKVEQILNIL